jgi:TRAP-type mannitol/chloroaromatic compound transport system substrate-binding protein
MTQWQMTLEMKDIMQKLRSNEFTLQEASKEIIRRLEKLRPKVESKFADYLSDFEDVIDDFEVFAEDDSMNDETGEFDYRLSNLYDWGDISLDNKFGGKKMCWINNF